MSTETTVRNISPHDAHSKLQEDPDGYVLVDVRMPSEYNSVHATPATLLPLNTLTPTELSKLSGKKIICICKSGSRGKQGTSIFMQNGFKDVYNVEGGTTAWESDGLSIVKGETATMSLERQVRIVAGSIVAIGVVAGLLISPYLLIIPLFVGCGLVFSGVTDTCGMAIALSRCPWNSK